MRRTAIRVLARLREGPLTVSELAEHVEKNQGWVSELVTELEARHLVEKNRQVHIADTYEASLIVELLETYNLETVLAGKREVVLRALLPEPRTVAELETTGVAASTAYQAVNDLQSTGVVERTTDEAYRIVDETLRAFLTASERTPGETVYRADDESVVVSSGDVDGDATAFSAFQRYGVEYFPVKQYRYRGERQRSLEDVLIHAVLCAENRKQMGMCGVFYLTHQSTLESNELWRLAGKWGCVERWADLLAYLDRRDVKQTSLFLPWDEFTPLAGEYDVYPRGKHPADSLLAGLDELGDTLDQRVDAYLLGGGNLILRGLKDTTKDMDVVLLDDGTVRTLTAALQALGYRERRDLEAAYEELHPSIVLEKNGFPRWDIFVEVVANALHLTDDMRERSDEHIVFGDLHLHLLSLTDIFLFKAVTDREGDLEDTAVIARQGAIDWQQIFAELQAQETVTETYFSFAVLDTLDLLVDRYGIDVPIRNRVASYCLRHALLLTLEEPKTITDLRETLDFPDHQIYNKLRKLEEQGRITVDRNGTLNEYVRTRE